MGLGYKMQGFRTSIQVLAKLSAHYFVDTVLNLSQRPFLRGLRTRHHLQITLIVDKRYLFVMKRVRLSYLRYLYWPLHFN